MREGHVEAAGVRLRYREAGEGAPLVHLQAAGTLALTPAHEQLARRFRVIALETPALPPSPELAATLVPAIQGLGLERFNLMATSGETATALWLAIHAPERVLAVILESPTASRTEGGDAELERRLSSLAMPILVVIGTRDDAVGPIPLFADTQPIPGAYLVFVYDAGHAVSTDRPEAFTEVASDFLERHEAFVIRRTATMIHP